MIFTGTIPSVTGHGFKNGIWKFERQMDPNKYVGFIYVIEDPFMSSFYLGKKHYKAKRGRNKGAESNWKTYTSSSKAIKLMLTERPLADFNFWCIAEYKTLSGLSHAETWSLCAVQALVKHNWYNRMINKVSFVVKESISKEHIARLSQVTKWDESYVTIDTTRSLE